MIFLSFFTLQVFGVGIPNPYRLRPFIGARVPVNSSFSPLINIHNPFSEPLQVNLSTKHVRGMLFVLFESVLDVFSLFTGGCGDVLQWWGSSSRAPHWSTRRHWETMGEL